MNILQVVSRLDKSQPAGDAVDSAKFLALNGHKVITMDLGNNIFLVPLLVFRLSRVIVNENIDVVHARDPLSAFVSFLASRRTKRPLVSTLSGERAGGFLAKTQTWAKRVIVLSENQARRILEKEPFLKSKIRVIAPFVASDKEPSPAKPRNLDNFFVVGILAPLSSAEKTEKLVKAVSILYRMIGRLKVFIVDTAPGTRKNDTEKFRLLIKRYLLGDIVTILPKNEATPVFDVFVGAEEKESAAAKFLLEAQSRSIPVIAHDVDWLGNYAMAGEGLAAVNTNDPKAMADKVYSLYKDERKRSAMSHEAQKFVKNKFGAKETAELLADVYSNIRSVENILVIKMGALGDAILAVPSLRAIREKFKGAKIKLLVDTENKGVFANCPYIDDLIVCDFKKRDKGFGGLLRLAGRLRQEGFDIVVDFQNNKKSHLLAMLSCAPERYGYNNGKFSFFLNRKVKDTGVPTPPVKHQERVLDLLGIHDIDESLALWPSKEDESWADEFLKSNWVKDNAKLAAFNIGSSPRWATKLWPAEYFVEVANRLAGESGTRVVLTGKEKDSPRTGEFLENAKFKPVNALGKTNITKLASLLKRCNVLISSDSAPIHIAAAVGTPFIALFGPTDPERHLPPADKFVVFKKDLECSPCYKTYCDKDNACMNAIRPDEVYEAIIKLLEIKRRQQ